MTTLVLWLDAPMQAWGMTSHFSHRDTMREPTKSGVIGLLCAALGRPRHASLTDLTDLQMGVRVDREGVVRRDFHTAGMGGVYKVGGGVERNNVIPSDRFYLADARFLVGLEGERGLLERLHEALRNPAWFLFFGRKAFMPAARVWQPDGLREEPLRATLASYRPIGVPEMPPGTTLRAVLDDPGGSSVRHDVPLSFQPRRFVPRQVSVESITLR